MTQKNETADDLDNLDNLVLDNKARFTVEEAQARMDAINAQFDVGDL